MNKNTKISTKSIYANAIPNGTAITNRVIGLGYTYNNRSLNTSQTVTPGKIHVQGDAVFEGDITWQGRNMREWFESVESRLAILQPNIKLEVEWSELAELRMRYLELERKLLEKQQIFDILKKSD